LNKEYEQTIQKTIKNKQEEVLISIQINSIPLSKKPKHLYMCWGEYYNEQSSIYY